MKKSYLPLMLALLFSLSCAATPLRAQSEPGYYTASDEYQYQDDLLYPEELDDLLARIALYPDPLIAQILPAATFVDQLHDAARFVRNFGNTPDIDYQPWDISVRAVAHYPQILYMMDREYQWTASLGQAYIEQPQDVMDSIQRLRRWANDQGNLYSTGEQDVFFDGDMIRIVPARPQYVYVPVYDPYVVYVERFYPATPAVTFSVAFTLGPWLNRDCDWRRHRVYYHGWRGTGWIRRSRPYVRDRRNIYINRRAAVINVNERVIQRDTRMYREQLRVETRQHRDERRMPQIPPGAARQPRPALPRPGRIDAAQPGSERRSEPWTRREQPPTRFGVPAPTTPPERKPGAPTGATKQREPAATQTPQGQAIQPQGRPVKVQPSRPGKPSPASTTPPSGKQPPSAVTGGRSAEQGKAEPRRRGPRSTVRPQQAQPPAAAPPRTPAAPATPAVSAPASPRPAEERATPRGVGHVPGAQPRGKGPAVTPVPQGRPVAPHPAPHPTPAVKPPQAQGVAPAPKGAEPATREAEPGQGRGRGEGPARQREER